MRKMCIASTAFTIACLLVAAPQPPLTAQETVACSKIWVENPAAIEEKLKTAEVVREEDIPIGVTKPKKMFVDPSAGFQAFAWKPLRPGMHRGFWDSYKAEIAAYELDKFLDLDMVPPAVERRIGGANGAAVLWLENVSPWKISEPVKGPDQVAWSRQVLIMKMFDNLIGNTDRNQGNLLYDGEYHLILIDHSRAFTSTKKLVNDKMKRVYKPFWDRLETLTEAELKPVLGAWLGDKEIRAVLERRDKMGKDISDALKSLSPAAVFMQ